METPALPHRRIRRLRCVLVRLLVSDSQSHPSTSLRCASLQLHFYQDWILQLCNLDRTINWAFHGGAIE